MKIKAVKILALLAGLTLLVFIIRKIGLNEILNGFHLLGWKIFIPVFVLFPAYLCYALSWELFLKRFTRHAVPFWKLFRIKVAGEASNMLTPLNFAGGDPLRVWLLSTHYPSDIGGASVVVDRTLHFGATIVVIILGNAAAFFILDLSPTLKYFLLGTIVLLVTFLLVAIFHQTQGIFRKIIRVLAKLKIKKVSPQTLQKIEELDRHLREFYQRDHRIFFVCLLLHLFSRVFLILEIYLLARFLDVPMSPLEALFFAAVIPMVSLISIIVPGALGIMEGAISALFASMHWDPSSGVLLQLGRRVRELIWLLIGMVLLLQLRHERNQR